MNLLKRHPLKRDGGDVVDLLIVVALGVLVIFVAMGIMRLLQYGLAGLCS